MVELRQIVSRWVENYDAHKNSIPKINVLEEELSSISGLEDEPYGMVRIPTSSKYLFDVGSACGNEGNILFSDSDVVRFLKTNHIKYLIGIIHEHGAQSAYDDFSIPLNALALPITGDAAKQFEDLASNAGGSFRYEKSKVNGWSVYESE